jgi:hypothetical protein
MVNTMLADRAEEGLDEAAVSATAHHQQVGSGRFSEQYLSGVPFPQPWI